MDNAEYEAKLRDLRASVKDAPESEKQSIREQIFELDCLLHPAKPITIEILDGATYRRDEKVWTKIQRNPSGKRQWIVACGFAGQISARWNLTATKRHAESISQGWFEDYGTLNEVER